MRFLSLALVALALFSAQPAAAVSSRAPADIDGLLPRVSFSGEDRQTTDWWFRQHAGAIKRSYDPAGKLPPRVDRVLAPNDRLPVRVPMAHLPWGLERLLSPLPVGQERLIVGRHIVLVDRRTSTILDVMRDVVR